MRQLHQWAGAPPYDAITKGVNAAWASGGRSAGGRPARSTVVNAFKTGRRRVNVEVFLAIVEFLRPDPEYITQWQQALRRIGVELWASGQAHVQSQLPDDLPGFTGRRESLDRLRRALLADGGTVAILGMAGTGKTTFAVHAAHLLNRERPFDHVLFAELRGFRPGPGQPPTGPGAVLGALLHELGHPGNRIPYDLDARSECYQNLVVGQRVLLILDDAATEEQVRPLLPRAAGCVTLVTSRRHLAGLPATYVPMEEFTPAESRDYLTRAVPDAQMGPDPGAVDRVIRNCGHLPLALAALAGHLRSHPDWTITDHADWLDRRHANLQVDRGVRLALALSYDDLPAGPQRLLRLLALHPGRGVDHHAAAALAGTDLADTARELEHLRRDHLLQRPAPGRYSLHNLVQAYAADRALDAERPQTRHEALTQLFDYYLAAAARATDTLFPAEQKLQSTPRTSTPLPAIAAADASRRWLETERATLVAVAEHTAANGWPTHAMGLSVVLFRFLAHSDYLDALSVHSSACRAAQEIGDQAGEAHAHYCVGVAYGQMGYHDAAIAEFDQAKVLFQAVGDDQGRARVLDSIGAVDGRRGRYQNAAMHHTEALELFRTAGDLVGEARALTNLGTAHERLGDVNAAVACRQTAVGLFRRARDDTGTAYALGNLGEIEIILGWLGKASAHLEEALRLYRMVGNRTGEAWTLAGLGDVDVRRRRRGPAAARYGEALERFREIGEGSGVARALNGLGDTAMIEDDAPEAIRWHEAALAAAVEAGDPNEQARAHTRIARGHRAHGRLDDAREQYGRALAIYTDLGAVEAERIRDEVDALGPVEPEPGS